MRIIYDDYARPATPYRVLLTTAEFDAAMLATNGHDPDLHAVLFDANDIGDPKGAMHEVHMSRNRLKSLSACMFRLIVENAQNYANTLTFAGRAGAYQIATRIAATLNS